MKIDADTFNDHYPVGTKVRYQPVAGYQKFEDTETRSIAWELGHGHAVVKVKGRAGGVSLHHIEVIE